MPKLKTAIEIIIWSHIRGLGGPTCLTCVIMNVQLMKFLGEEKIRIVL